VHINILHIVIEMRFLFLLFLIGCGAEINTFDKASDTLYFAVHDTITMNITDSTKTTPRLVSSAGWGVNDQGNNEYGVWAYCKMQNIYDYTMIDTKFHIILYDDGHFNEIAYEDSSSLYWSLGNVDSTYYWAKYIETGDIAYAFFWLYPDGSSYHYAVWLTWQ